jgi:Tol biopolymer transport system component
MTPRYNLGIPLLLLATVLTACGGDSTAPPTTGTIDFNFVTTGVDIDADGFLLTVDGGSPQAIPANGTLSISSLPGSHTLTISGLAFNCDMNTVPASAAVTVGHATKVDVRASCTPYLRNAILYISQEFGLNEVLVMRPDGSRRERLTNDNVNYYGPVVSPDGQSIAVSSGPPLGGSDGIFVLDRFGKGRTKAVGLSNFDGAPAWSPDGKKLAFRSFISCTCGDYGRIFIVNRDGTGLRQLTPETTDYTFDDGAWWSPDGTRLVFSRNGVLHLINADGTGLTSTGVPGSYPAWSPDGSQIAYGSINGGIDGIWAMNMSFTPRRLTTPLQADQMPRWSPDGSQLVFLRVEGNVFHLYRMAADGTGATRLTTATQDEEWASWSPNF